MKKITEVQGIGEAYAAKLGTAGIENVEQLLEKGAASQGRKQMAEESGITEKLILRWVNMADLFRIKGIGEEFADLLEAGGVDTVPELGQRNAENLHKKLEEVNEAKNLVRRVPTSSEVGGWIDQAKALPRVVTY